MCSRRAIAGQGAHVVEGVGELARARRGGGDQVHVGAVVDAGGVPLRADVVVAVAERLELARDQRVVQALVDRRQILAAGPLDLATSSSGDIWSVVESESTVRM